MKWWLISNEDVSIIRDGLGASAQHILDSGLNETSEVPRDFRFCPECGEFKPDDDRVKEGMKCGQCAY